MVFRAKKRNTVNLWSSFLLSHFQYGQVWFGVREGMLGAYCWLLWLVLVGGWAAFPQFPLDWFKVFAGVAHS